MTTRYNNRNGWITYDILDGDTVVGNMSEIGKSGRWVAESTDRTISVISTGMAACLDAFAEKFGK